MKFIGKISQSPRLFNLVSWGITALIVAVVLGFAAWRITRPVAAAPGDPVPTRETGTVALPSLDQPGERGAITRVVSLMTSIPEHPNYDVVEYTVGRGDSLFGIASQFDIEPESVLWANTETLGGSADGLRIGQVLNIPPVNGVYYQWKEDDTLESVAAELEVDPEVILSWPGNDVDLTNPVIAPGEYVMVPGGQMPSIQIEIPIITRDSGGGAGVSACGGGAVGTGSFIWPAGNRFLSGNDYWSEHLGIDIAADEGAPIYAADSGVVTMASLGWNYGYGNTVQIDHGNGFVTLYAHLSQVNVGICQSIYQGQVIGASGNTGNSFGAHLHFEVRLNGSKVNPWNYLH